MSTVTFRPDPDRPPELTEQERARLERMDDAGITEAAERDPDNPPLSDAELSRAALARVARDARRRVGLSQKAFAARYRIGYGRLRDIEQGRGRRVDSVLLAYLTVIKRAPDTVERALDSTD